MRVCFYFGVSLWFLSIQVSAQNTTKAKLSGKVIFADEQLVEGAHVVLSPGNLTTITNQNGQFEFGSLSFGKYDISITFIGSQVIKQAIVIDKPLLKLNFQFKDGSEVLEEVTVKTKSEATEIREDPIQIESIELKNVSNRVKDIGEAIERLPGVNIRGSGSFGDRVDVTLNGLNGTAVRTYIDGIPLEFIYPALNLANIPIDIIERVDVYKGVVPLEVGTDALGGGVNVVTKRRYDNQIKATYGYGSFETHQSNLIAAYKVSNHLSLSTNLTYNFSKNNYTMDAFEWESRQRKELPRFHDEYRLFFASVNLNVIDVSWADYLSLNVNYSNFFKEIQNGGQINNFAFGDARYSGDIFAYTLKYEKRIRNTLNLKTSLNYSKNNIIFIDTTANLYSWSGKVIQRQENQRGELDENAHTDRDFQNVIHRINLSWDITDQDQISVSNLLAHQSTIGRDYTEDKLEDDFLTRKQRSAKNIVGLQYQRKLFKDRILARLGAKYYYYELKGVENFSFQDVFESAQRPGYFAALKYTINEHLFIRSSYENALRIPLFEQFFGDGASILSNVFLKPERSDNFNLGFSYASPGRSTLSFKFNANGFFRGQKEIIYLTNDLFQQYQNSESIRTIGGEAQIALKFWKVLELRYNITRLSQNYESISSSNNTAQFLVGRPFPNIPKFYMNILLNYSAQDWMGRGDKIRFYVQYKYVDEFNFINVGQIYDPANYVPVQHRIDLGVSVAVLNERVTLNLNANNIFDNKIFDNFSIPRPGRNFNFKLTYNFFNF